MIAPATPAFCATCVEERTDLKRCLRKGRTVFLCPDCQDPLGILRQHDIADHEAAAQTLGRRDGGKWRTGRGGRP